MFNRTTTLLVPSDFQLSSWFLVFHYVKSVHIRSFSGPFLPAFGLNTERYPASINSLRMWENTDQKNSEYGHFLRNVDYRNYP